MRISSYGRGFALLLLAVTASTAWAAQHEASAPAATAASHHASEVAGFGTSVTGKALAGFRGGSEITINNMTLTGTVDNNSADHVTTGANTIADGAFNGAVGVPMVIQNSGNNVLIQNATIINVQFKP